MDKSIINELLVIFGNNKQAASALGITAQYWSRVVNGAQKASPKLAQKATRIIAEEKRRRDNRSVDWIGNAVDALVRKAYQEGRKSVTTLEELEANREASRND